MAADLALRTPLVLWTLLLPAGAAAATADAERAAAQDRDVDEEELLEDDDPGASPSEPGREAPARREDAAQRILFVGFAPVGGVDREAAALSEEVLADLRSRPELDVVVLEDVPPIFDTPAPLYLEGCPEGQESGCQLVLGEKVQADRVVGGRVELRRDRPRLIVQIIHVEEAEVEQAYAVEVEEGRREAVVRSVAETLDRLANPPEEEVLAAELRGGDEEARERERLAREKAALQALAPTLGQAGLELLELDRKLMRPQRISLKDLQDVEQGEYISTPWQDLGLTKRQYVSFRNSGLHLDEWKHRAAGHHLQVLLGVSGGFSLPFASDFALRYYGHYIMDATLQNVEDAYAYQSLDRAGLRPRGEATVGFGVLPFLDFEYTLGVVQVPVYRQKEDGKLAPNSSQADPSYRLVDTFQEDPVDLLSHTFKLRVYPLRLPRVRPSIAVGYGLMAYPDLKAIEMESSPNSRHILFERFTLHYIDIEPGVMFELGQRVGLFIHAPIWIDITADAARTQELETGPQYGLLETAFTDLGQPTGLEPLPSPGRVSAFLIFGVQVRPNPVFVGRARRDRDDFVIEEP